MTTSEPREPLALTTSTWQFGTTSLTIRQPERPELILEQAVIAEQTGVSGHDPYWGLLWDAATKTAAAMLHEPWQASLTVLELGCGIGLAGVAALAAGHSVTFSDLVPEAVRLAQSNAALNGYPDAPGLTIDWRDPPEGRFDLLLASDVLYDQANHAPLLQTCRRLLKPGGVVWIGDAGRHHAGRFVQLAAASGWSVLLRNEQGEEYAAPQHLRFQLIVLSGALPCQKDPVSERSRGLRQRHADREAARGSGGSTCRDGAQF